MRKFNLFLKRTFDIVVSLGCVILFTVIPVMIIVPITIRLSSKGPAIFKQERLGKGGKPFTMYKFRSMYINAEENGPQWADKIDAERAENAYQRAQAVLQDKSATDTDLKLAEARLRRALVRKNVASLR